MWPVIVKVVWSDCGDVQHCVDPCSIDFPSVAAGGMYMGQPPVNMMGATNTATALPNGMMHQQQQQQQQPQPQQQQQQQQPQQQPNMMPGGMPQQMVQPNMMPVGTTRAHLSHTYTRTYSYIVLSTRNLT